MNKICLFLCTLFFFPLAANLCCDNGCYRVTGDWLLLNRFTDDKTIAINNNTGDKLLDLKDLNDQFESGGSLAISRECGRCESQFKLLMGSWKDDISTHYVQTFGQEAQIFTTIESAYKSKLKSYELNQFCDCACDFRALFGVRFIGLNEVFRIQTTAGSTAIYRVSTYNDLLGVQFGGHFRRCFCDRFELNVMGKYGIYINHVEKDFEFSSTANMATECTSQIYNGAFVGELDANITVNVNRCYHLRFGYLLLALQQVGLAGENYHVGVAAASQLG